MSTIRYSDRLPEIQAFFSLFETTGWNESYHASCEQLGTALANSWYTLSAYDGDRLVGFGRLVCDGTMHAMVFDLIVHPTHQNRGIGSEVLRRLVQVCREAGIRDVQLFSATGKAAFYEQLGFVARSEDAPGMQLVE